MQQLTTPQTGAAVTRPDRHGSAPSRGRLRLCWSFLVLVAVVLGFPMASALAAAPSGQFTDSTTAQSGATHGIVGLTPDFSWTNNGPGAATTQRVQVVSDDPSNVVGLWHLDGNGTATVGNNMTVAAGVPGWVASMAGFSQALSSPGNPMYLQSTSTAAQDINVYTVEAWIKIPLANVDTSTTHNHVVSKQVTTPNTRSFGLGVLGNVAPAGGAICASGTGAAQNSDLRGSTVVADNTWHHLVCTRDASGLARLYVDGVQEASKMWSSVTTAAGGPINIAHSTSSAYFKGTIDDVRISNVAMTSAEVLADYQAAAPHFSLLWDSDPTDAGVAMSSCPASTRCADIAYGSSGSAPTSLVPNRRYWARAEFGNAWASWSSYDWFQTTDAPTDFFTHNTTAANSSTNPSDISATAPHFSFVNNAGAARDKQRVQVLTSPIDDVVGLWHFDTATGAMADSSGNGMTLTPTGSPTAPAGQTNFSQALGVNGSSQYAQVTDNRLDLPNAYTVEAWFKTSDISSLPWPTILSKQDTSGGFPSNFGLMFNRAGGTLRFSTTQNNAATSIDVDTPSTGMADGLWHHVAATYDGSNVKLYFDGVLKNSLPATGSLDTASGLPLTIGIDSPGSTEYFKGQIDDVRISSVARTAAEISDYYALMRPHFSVLWDSDPTDAGVAMTSCNNQARCGDVTYGATGSAPVALSFSSNRYWVRSKLRAGAGAWGSWSVADWFETGANTAPDAPTALAQYRSDGTTVIGSGGATPQSTSVLKFSAADANSSQILTPWVEVRPTASAFSATCGQSIAGVTFSGPTLDEPVAATGATAAVTVTGLADGTYKWRACSVDQTNGLSAWVNKGASPDFIVDSTAPTNPTQANVFDLDLTATTDVDWTSSTTALTASWNVGSDAQSGVASYSGCFSTVNTGCTAIPGTAQQNNIAPGARTMSATATAMVNGTMYYFCVQTLNGAGTAAAAWQCSDGFTIDTTAPTNPTQANIFDLDLTATTDVDWSSSTTALTASWNAGTDAQSSVASYSGCFSSVNTGCTAIPGTTQQNNIAPGARTMSATATAMTNGTMYYFCVQTVNGAGATAAAWQCSDGFTIDTTAPTNPTQANLFDLDLTATTDQDWTNSTTALTASWNAGADAQSGVASYSGCFSTVNTGCTAIAGTAQQNNIAPGSRTMSATATAMTNATMYYFCVRTVNVTGMNAASWQCSDGFTIDTTAPTNPTQANVFDLDLTATADQDWTSSATALSASWNVGADAQSGVGSYSGCFSTVNTGCTAIAGTAQQNNIAPGARTMSATATAMTSGTTYYFCVRTVNAAGGTAAAWQCSDGFLVDTSAPTNPAQANLFDLDLTATTDQDWSSSTTALTASWNVGADAQSGVGSYSGCFSTVNTGCTAIVGTAQQNNIAPASRTMSATATAMSNGTTYFFCVRTVNNAGTAAAAWRCSDGFTIDTTPPNVPTLVSPAAAASIVGVTSALTATYLDGAPASPGRILFELCQDATCTTVLDSGTSTTTSITTGSNGSWTPGAQPYGTYYWRARNQDGAGQQGAWSATRSFDLTSGMSVGAPTPASLPQGRQATTVQINGTGFQNGATVSVTGGGVSVGSTTWMSATRIDVTLTIAGNATVSSRDITVTNPDTSAATGTGEFDVTAPAITVGLTTLGYEDPSPDASGAGGVSFGTFMPGIVRTIGPVGSGQMTPGAAVSLDVTSDTDYQVQVQSTAWSDGGTMTMPVGALAWRAFSTANAWTAMTTTATAAGGAAAPGTQNWSYDMQLSTPPDQAAGDYTGTVTYTITALP